MTVPRGAPSMTGAELQELFDNDPDLQAHTAAVQREYGHYVANQRIYAGNALAYAPGHQVPISNVVRLGYWFNGQVDLADGKEHPPEMQALIDERAAAEAEASTTDMAERPPSRVVDASGAAPAVEE